MIIVEKVVHKWKTELIKKNLKNAHNKTNIFLTMNNI